MFEIFQYPFMRRALVTGLLIAVVAPCIGVVIVLRRMSMIGHSLSHTSLAGVAAGLAGGINPILGATVFAVFSALGIEKVRKSFPQFSEVSIAIITSLGIGLAGILSGFAGASASLEGYLFGSIVAISEQDMYIIIGLSLGVFFTMLLLYRELFYITFDEESARLAGVPVKTVNFLFTIMTAVIISVSSRTVGVLIISSIMVLPVASAMQVAKSYRQTMVYSALYGLLSTLTGLCLSYYLNLKPGGTIVIVSAVMLILTIAFKTAFNSPKEKNLPAKTV